MRKIYVGISLISLLFFTAGCAAQQRHYFVDSSFIAPYQNQEIRIFYTLTPDGNFITLSDLSQVELKTGNRDRPFDDILTQDWQDEHAVKNLHWSPDGRYLAITTQSLLTSPSILSPVYIIDTRDRTISEALDIAPFFCWSPFDNEYTIASSMEPATFTSIIYHMFDLSPVRYETIVQKKADGLGGSGYYLWNQRLNMPIGKIVVIDPINAGGKNDTQKIAYSGETIQ